jgi:acetyl-CoA carboxylase biotin carboxyl carrier protein
MSTSDQDNPQRGEQGGSGTGAAAAPQVEAGSSERGQSSRHGRGRRRGGGARPEQRQQQPSRRAEPMLNLDEVRELTELFSEHGLTDFEFENADIRIRLSRNPAPGASASFAPPATHAAQTPAHAATAQASPSSAAAQQSEQQPAKAEAAPPEEELHIITAEMVGTFYRSPSQDAEPFVKVGSQVETGTVVCIIEAMKLMNEIEAETTGTVAKIYVENGQPVEYGQPLFGVKK